MDLEVGAESVVLHGEFGSATLLGLHRPGGRVVRHLPRKGVTRVRTPPRSPTLLSGVYRMGYTYISPCEGELTAGYEPSGVH